jgi:hypothetical protein
MTAGMVPACSFLPLFVPRLRHGLGPGRPQRTTARAGVP